MHLANGEMRGEKGCLEIVKLAVPRFAVSQYDPSLVYLEKHEGDQPPPILKRGTPNIECRVLSIQ